MSSPDQKRRHVFISYSRKDAKWLERLRVHLRPLEREHRIEIWDDTKIVPGSKWRDEITKALGATRIAVLLVSADFLASDFITTDELPPLLVAAAQDGAIILPVILSPSRFQRTSLAAFQSVNNPAKPMITLNRGEQEAVLVRVAEAVEFAFDSWRNPTIEPESPATGEKDAPRETESQENIASPVSQLEVSEPRESKLSWLKWNPKLWLVLVSGLVALAATFYLLVRQQDPNVVQCAGWVNDVVTQNPIPNARVTIGSLGPVLTDSRGIFRVELPASTVTVRIKVEADKYVVHEEMVPVSAMSLQAIGLELHRLPEITTTPTATPEASPKPTNSPSPQLSRMRRPCTTYERLVKGLKVCWSYAR